MYLVPTPVVPSTGYLSTGFIWKKNDKSFDIGKSCQRRIWVPSTNQPTPIDLILVIIRPRAWCSPAALCIDFPAAKNTVGS